MPRAEPAAPLGPSRISSAPKQICDRKISPHRVNPRERQRWVVVLKDGTKYVSSVRFGSVSQISPGKKAKLVAAGIPSAASMCYDSKQHQLVIPMNNHNALAFVKLD